MIQTLYPPFRHWSETGTIWLYSDPHFGDTALAAGMPGGRPSDQNQIDFINSKVGKKDTLIILGDVGDINCAKKLRGHKILICGNHDAGSTLYEDVFEEVYPGPVFISERILLSHEPIDLPFAFNIHGHDHMLPASDNRHLNVCSDVIGYVPVNFNRLLKSGILAKIPSVHRITIDTATKRAKKRHGKGQHYHNDK